MSPSINTPTFKAYIDESGDEGFSFGAGSSEWFVLSCAITRSAEDLQTVKLVDDVKELLNKPPKKPLHFCDLKHEQKLPYIQKIAQADLKAISILVHKPSLKEPEKFMQRYRLYFYCVRYLVERLSWYCSTAKRGHDLGDGSVEIIFSNRSGMSYDELKNYLGYLRQNSNLFKVRIDWNIIKESQITAYSAGMRRGLQVADAIAGSFYFSVQPSQYGFTETKYAIMLKPIVYHHKGFYNGYGVKFWPREVKDTLLTMAEYGWIKEWYK